MDPNPTGRTDARALAEELSAVKAERDRLRDERDMFRDHAIPEAATVMNVLSTTLAETQAERDHLRERIAAYEGDLEEWEHLARAEAAEAERDRLRAALHELMARDVDAVDLMNAEYGCPDCGVHHACGEIVAELDRLRMVVEQALNLGEDEGMQRGKTPYPDWWVLLDRALDPRYRLDGGAEATDG